MHWWVVGLKREHLELEPGVSQASPMLNSSHHVVRGRSGPEVVEQELWGSWWGCGDDWWQSPSWLALWPRPKDLGTALLCWFHISHQCVCLGFRLGWGYTTELVSFSPKCKYGCVCQKYYSPWSWFYALLSVCTNAHTCNGCLCPGQRQGQGPTQLCSLFSLHTLIWNGCLCLNWEQHQSKRDWSRSPVRAAWHAVSGTGKQARSLGSFHLAVSMLWMGLSKVCVCTLEEQSLNFSGKPHWFSN